MNKQRRADLRKALDLIEQAKEIILNATNDEQESFDNLPESIQYSERGEKMESAISNLEDASGYLDDVTDYINEAIEN